MANIKDIAEMTNVSISTVSRVLNYDETLKVSKETRKKIFEAAEELEYVTLRERKNKGEVKKDNSNFLTIGVIHEATEEEELIDPYFLSIRLGIEKQCLEEKIRFITMRKEDNYWEMSDIDGLVVIGRSSAYDIDKLTKITDNLVFVDEAINSNEDKYDAVVLNFETAVIEALDYLMSLGHTRIGFMGGKEQYDNKKDNNRINSFEKYTKEKGIYNPKYILKGNFLPRDGYRLMKSILNEEDIPTAFFIASDSMAIGAYKAIFESGLSIPNDISIVGFDDIPMAKYMMPMLTTMKVHSEYMGQCAVELLVDRIKKGGNISKKVIIPVKLKIRESCTNIITKS